jgi:hypothetical protein
VSTDSERQSKVRALIPRGESQAQAIFRVATALAYGDGVAIRDAIEFGVEQARQEDPEFEPKYDVAVLLLD